MTPIAEIVGGSLRWHVPHAAYAVPVEYLRGSHMLYAATQSEKYDPLTDYLRIRLRLASADFLTLSEPMREVCAEADAALQAQAAEIAVLRAALVRLQADGIHSCHADCTRSGCVNARLREEKDELAKLANALLHQIDINDFQDSHGHSAKSFKAVHDLMLALAPTTGEKP